MTNETLEIIDAGFQSGLWGRTSSAPYQIGTDEHKIWKDAYTIGAQQRFETLGYWGPDRS